MFVLRRSPGGLPEYLTMDAEMTIGSAIAWTPLRERALQFATSKDAETVRKKGTYLGFSMTGVEVAE